MIPAYYLMVAGAVGCVSTFFLHETAGRPLPGSRAMAETPGQARRLQPHGRRLPRPRPLAPRQGPRPPELTPGAAPRSVPATS